MDLPLAFCVTDASLTRVHRQNAINRSSFVSNSRYRWAKQKRRHGNSRLLKCTAGQSDSTSTEDVVSREVLESALLNQQEDEGMFSKVLIALFNKKENKSVSDVLGESLTENVVWNNALFDAKGRNSVVENINLLQNFVLDSRIEILSERESREQETETEWLFSFTYPLPWGPRVIIAGSSKCLFDSDGLVERIDDSWRVSPWSVIRQAVFRFTDAFWLWATPHAESDIGLRREISKTPDYTIVCHAAHPEFRVRDDIQPNEERIVWAIGSLPNECFIGKLRKREAYDTVTPISVRRIDGLRFEWAVAMPGSSFGVDLSTLDHPMNNATYVKVHERRFAVKRYKGFATGKNFYAQREKLLDALVRDKLLSKERAEEESRVWSRLYEAKLGFNSTHVPTIASYGGVLGVPRVNEIAVELDDVIS